MIEVGSYRYTNQDARKTLLHAGDLFDLLARGNNPDTIAPQRAALTAVLAQSCATTTECGLDALGEQAARSLGLPGWDTATYESLLTVLHQQWESAAAALRANGETPASAIGRVAQLNTSGGGVPKQRRETVDVTFQGVRGDAQNSRDRHGRPWQALCIWNAESIDSLKAEGHPIFAGAAGENVTVAGIPWSDVRPGTRLRLGDALVDIWAYAVPCRQQRAWFSDGDFARIHHDNGSISRVYARVLETGQIATGDEVVLEPPPGSKPRKRPKPETESTSAPQTVQNGPQKSPVRN